MNRMLYELPEEIHMAIRLRAIKDGIKNGEVFRRAMEIAFPDDVAEAKKELKKKEGRK